MESTARKPPPAKPEAVSQLRPKEITIELTVPVQAFGTTVKKLTFRRPTGADVMGLGDSFPDPHQLADRRDAAKSAGHGRDHVNPGASADLDNPKHGRGGFLDLRACTDGFFLAGRPGDAVIDCYRLAQVYGRNPAEFLALTLDEIDQHIKWTDRMLAAKERWTRRG